MVEFIINSLIWILALYGFIEIIREIIYIFTYTNFKADGIYTIIAVKNQEDKIEGFLRSTLFRVIYGKEEMIKNIILTDLGSTDNTKMILEKFGKDYDFIKFVDWKECKELMENINSVEKSVINSNVNFM